MNWLDIVIIVIAVVAAFLGLKNGLIKVVLSLAGLVVGVMLAGRYYLPLSERLSFIPQTNLAEGVAFAIILIAVSVVAALLARILSWATSAVMLGWINGLGGAAFGLVLGLLIFGAFLAIWMKFLGTSEIIEDSNLAAVVLEGFSKTLAILPRSDAVRSFLQ